MKRTITFAFLCMLLGFLKPGCQNYDSHTIRTRDWQSLAQGSLRDIGIGYFESRGSGKSPLTRDTFYDSLAFALREQGYITREFDAIHKTLKANQLPYNRLLDAGEILRLTREFGGRLYLQGKIEEKRTETLLEDLLQVSITIWIYDAHTGQKIGEIKTFAHDMEYLAAPQLLELTRHSVEELETLIASERTGDVE